MMQEQRASRGTRAGRATSPATPWPSCSPADAASRLMELTDRRAKPAVYFGGKFRIIDFALSNCAQLGHPAHRRRDAVQGARLIRHLQRGWNFLRGERNEGFDILPARSASTRTSGTSARPTRCTRTSTSSRADRARVHRHAGRRPRLQDGLRDRWSPQHVESGGRTSPSAASRCRAWRRRRFGVMAVDADDAASPPSSRSRPIRRRCRAIRTSRSPAWASTSSTTQFLIDLLRGGRRRSELAATTSARTSSRAIVENGKAVAHPFSDAACAPAPSAEPYWRDVGTVDAFWEANVDLTDFIAGPRPLRPEWPIWTYAESTPPAKFVHDEDGRARHGDSSLVSRRLHHLRLDGRQVGAVHRRAGAFLRQPRPTRSSCPT